MNRSGYPSNLKIVYKLYKDLWWNKNRTQRFTVTERGNLYFQFVFLLNVVRFFFNELLKQHWSKNDPFYFNTELVKKESYNIQRFPLSATVNRIWVQFLVHVIDICKICIKLSDLTDIHFCLYNSIKINHIEISIIDFERDFKL